MIRRGVCVALAGLALGGCIGGGTESFCDVARRLRERQVLSPGTQDADEYRTALRETREATKAARDAAPAVIEAELTLLLRALDAQVEIVDDMDDPLNPTTEEAARLAAAQDEFPPDELSVAVAEVASYLETECGIDVDGLAPGLAPRLPTEVDEPPDVEPEEQPSTTTSVGP